MILSKQHKFIFIHVPRTGGKSIRRMWGKQNTLYKQHMTYPVTVKTLKGVNFNEYFTFGFIRNPWERIYSLFCKHVNNSLVDTSKGFKYWMFDETRADSKRHKQSAMHFLKGVDYIARYEKFEEEWDYIFDKIELPRIKIPHINKFRNDDKSYKELYDDRMMNFITQYHQDDINYGEYTV